MIGFSADHHFHIGQAHLNSGKPCQDYALSGILDGAAFALVADGCSSGGYTETGAQILVHAAAKAIREHWSMNRCIAEDTRPHITMQQRMILTGACDALGLKQNDLLATSAIVYLSPLGGFVHLVGDGVIAYKNRGEETCQMHRFDWANNMPFYLSYAQSPDAFIRAQGGDLDACRMTHEAVWYDGSEFRHSAQHIEITLREGMRGVTHWLSAEELAELEYIAVFTDGVTQFKDQPWADIVHALLAFKSTEGEFMKRRLGRVVKDAQKSGNNPMDDVGAAVIRLVQIPEKGDAPC